MGHADESITQRSPLELDRETMRALAHEVSETVVEHLARIGEQPAQRTLSRHEARALIASEAPETGEPLETLLSFFRDRVVPYHAREPHPRFVGYVPSCPTFVGALGDWLASGYNFFSGVWSVAAGPNELELTVLDWFRGWLGMPDGTSGLLTSGGSSATFTAVVAARHGALGADDDATGTLAMYTSEQAHSSVARAGWMAGIPRRQVRAIPTDDAYRMDVAALERAIAADRAAGLRPFMVAGSAGTTNTGAVDPLGEIADVCRRERLWMHVDAAYAGFAALTEQGRRQLRGIERADSVTLDPHKWLFIPFECGCLLARDPRALERAFSVHPEYLADVRAREHEVNFADYGEQLTRGPRALKVWLSVRYYGVARIRDAIARGIAMAEYAERIVRDAPDLEVLSPARFGVLCFRARGTCASDSARAALNARNERINARVNATGRFLMSSTVLRGHYSLRICTHGFRTTASDIDALMAAVRAAVSEEAE